MRSTSGPNRFLTVLSGDGVRAMFARKYKSYRGKAAFRDFLSVSGFPLKEGADGIMAKIIEFYVPKDFRPSAKPVPPPRRGQVIEFYIPKKSA